MSTQLIVQLVSLPFDIAIVVLLIRTFIHLINRKHQARKPQPIPGKTYYAAVGDQVWYAHIPGTAYEVGSPEYNAQLAGAIRALNERLASQGKRIPEKVTIDIARQINEEYGQQ